MARTAIPQSIQTEVLLACRRRCCICFGVDRKVEIAAGQIAHLDRKNSNNAADNLAFLCLDHHDEYDSSTSQRKNYTISEVKAFRAELLDFVAKSLAVPVHFGEIMPPSNDPYAGQYTRLGTGTDSAEIVLTPIPDGFEEGPRYYISGTAFFGSGRPFGPNMGEMGWVGTVVDDVVIYERPGMFEEPATTLLKFLGEGILHVDERNPAEYGMSVNFSGTYKRTS